MTNESSSQTKGGKRPRPPSLLRRAWKSYSSALNVYPLRTKAIAAAVIFFTSDAATQYLTRDQFDERMRATSSFDLSRAASGATFGVIATGWLHYWWGFLERVAEARLPVARYRLANTLTKVFLDQAIGAPLYIYSYYFVTNILKIVKSKEEISLNESLTKEEPGQTSDKPVAEATREVLAETHDKAVRMLLPTMPRHWKLWPFVHTVNFYFVPLHHRVLVQNCVLVGWSGYLSHLNHGGLANEKLVDELVASM